MIADAHLDLLQDLSLRDQDPDVFARDWLPQLQAGGVAAQVCAVACEDRVNPGANLVQALRQAAAFRQACRRNSGQVLMVACRADLDTALESGRIGMVLALEGVDAVGRHLGVADALVDLGVRMVGLTWQFRNDAADGAAEPPAGGLSTFGRQLVARLLDRGVILDVAHASEGTFDDVLDLVSAHGGNVLCSHGGCRALLDEPRNLSDDQLRRLAAAGGVMGIAAVPHMLSADSRDLPVMVGHIRHAVEVMGAEHVCLGGDFFAQLLRSMPAAVAAIAATAEPGAETDVGALDGLAGPEDYGTLVSALHETGLPAAQVEDVLHGNLIRFLRRSLP
ncbi:dipeptidase [Amycolatopsis jejuensis]|uniref:dipeptidase n=1 Tax=Amycolatopsis jejuensis TaxID=330084 RepID=UPI00068AEEE6|nr:membrane dipeptidase [Amycolatopsis jejuensis]